MRNITLISEVYFSIFAFTFNGLPIPTPLTTSVTSSGTQILPKLKIFAFCPAFFPSVALVNDVDSIPSNDLEICTRG